MRAIAIIPARYDSTRFKGKPLRTCAAAPCSGGCTTR